MTSVEYALEVAHLRSQLEVVHGLYLDCKKAAENAVTQATIHKASESRLRRALCRVADEISSLPPDVQQQVRAALYQRS